MAYLSNLDPFLEAVRTGKYAGKTCYDYSAHGINPDVDTAAPEDVWGQGGTFVPPTTARLHNIVSTDINDDGAPVGTGARTITIYGITVAGLVSETVTMNGTTNVATANSYYDIYLMENATVGSGGTNAGVITATAQTDATVTNAILIGQHNSSMRAIRYIPTGFTGYLFDWNTSFYQSTAGYTAEVGIFMKYSGGVWICHGVNTLVAQGNSAVARTFKPPMVIPAENWVKLMALTVSNNNTVVSGEFNLLIVAD